MHITQCEECHRSSLRENFLSVITGKNKGVCRACDSNYWLEHSNDVLTKYNEYIREYPSLSSTAIQSGYLSQFTSFLYNEYWYFEINTSALKDIITFIQGLPEKVVLDNASNVNYFLGQVHTEKVI